MRRRWWTSHWCMRADTANQARSQEQPPFRDQAHFSEFFLSVQSLVKQNNLRQQSHRRLSDCWQMVCKPGSVGLLAQSGRSFLFEHGRPCSLAAYPRCLDRGGRLSPHIWPCSNWGLPCRTCCHERGGLLLHLFTLATVRWRSLFCGTFRRELLSLFAPRRYLAACPLEPGLSSNRYHSDTIRDRPTICQLQI